MTNGHGGGHKPHRNVENGGSGGGGGEDLGLPRTIARIWGLVAGICKLYILMCSDGNLFV